MIRSHQSQLLEELIRFVRAKSPFYREIYEGLPEQVVSTVQLPVLRQDAFWNANTLENNRLLTGPMTDGLILKSGGTTGKPKFSVFSRDEWDAFTQAFAITLSNNGLRHGDRVANLFYVGELYGSFLFTHSALEKCPTRVLQLPVAGSTELSTIQKLLRDFNATVIAALPTTIMSLVEYAERHHERPGREQVRLILFAGEAMYPDQRECVKRVFPNAEIRSIGYASTDAGFLGYSDLSCGPNEFRCHEASTLYEILDEETGQPITETGRSGKAVLTDLNRYLMPVIRYPAGDRAMWLEPEGTPDRKFLLLGRSEESARIGPVTLYFEDVRSVLESFRESLGPYQFQLVLLHRNTRDGLMIRIAARASSSEVKDLESRLVAALYLSRPMYRECLEDEKILPIEIEWVDPSELEINHRSGKLKRVIDLRSVEWTPAG